MTDTPTYQINFKTIGDTLINLRADRPEDMSSALKNLEGMLLEDLQRVERVLKAVGTVGQTLGGQVVGTEQGPSSDFAQQGAAVQHYQQVAQQGYQAPPQAPQGNPRDTVKRGGSYPPPGPRPSCQHGERFWNSFESKKGKTIKQWLCPLDSGDYKNPAPGQCDAEWA